MHDIDCRELGESWNTYVYKIVPCLSLSFWAGGLIKCSSLPGFVAFDQYKRLLADADGKVTGPRAALAGFAAGVTESLLAVTPTESIKTQLYVPISVVLLLLRC